MGSLDGAEVRETFIIYLWVQMAQKLKLPKEQSGLHLDGGLITFEGTRSTIEREKITYQNFQNSLMYTTGHGNERHG